jgi:hypothetical protein
MRNGLSPQYLETHCLAQRGYLEWKAGIFADLGPRLSLRTRDTIQVFMRLGQAKVLRQYRASFYPNGTKVVPAAALGRLTELGLAVWCMDDGGLRGHRRLTIATDGWDLDTQFRLREWFTRRWGLTPRIERAGLRKKPHVIHGRPVKSSRITFRLTFNVNDTVAILRLIEPHAHPIFRDKWRLDDPSTYRPAMTHAERGRAGMNVIRGLLARGVLVRPPGFAKGHTYVNREVA